MVPVVNLQVVPEGWAARHRPVVAGFFCDTVTVERPTTTYSAKQDRVTTWAALTPPGGVPALVQVVHAQSTDDRDGSGQPVLVADYLARLDVEWLPEPGDRLTVTSSPDPANLGTYIVARRESQGHVVDRTIHLTRTGPAVGAVR